MNFISNDQRAQIMKRIRLMADVLESDLSASDWSPEGFAQRVRERAESLAAWVASLGASTPEGALYSLFTHKGRVHIQFPPSWVEGAEPLFASRPGRWGTEAFVFFPAVGAAYRIAEDCSGFAAGIGQPVPVVEAVDHASIEWSEEAPAVFEPLEKVRIYGGSNSPILLGAV